ncbi:MAG: sugar phosphate isomerase/epimerase [Planctomycetales bacterium]|nr:sugar phosphate isomerase/epimerase [Planctomycetales bacterium]
MTHKPQSLIARRSFLSTVTASTAGMAAASFLPGNRAVCWAAGEDHALKLGIQLYSLRGYSVDEALQHAKDLGFAQVEFYSGMLALDSSAEQIAAMRKKVADLGMTISAHGVNHLGADAAANRKTFEFAKALGIPTITADPDPDSFDNLDELVKEFDIRVAIHNHGPNHRYNKAIDVLHAIEGHDERIGACADLGHFIRSGQRPTEVIRLLKGRLYGIHLKDFEEMKDRTKGVILGKGHLDVRAVFDALMAVNFPANGALSLEYEENPQDPIAEIRECVAVAKQALAQMK